jgi:hypothetical protein
MSITRCSDFYLDAAGEACCFAGAERNSMKQRGITMVDVLRATVALRKQGRVAGPQNLRLELERGSYSTICRHMRRLALVHTGVRAGNGRRANDVMRNYARRT